MCCCWGKWPFLPFTTLHSSGMARERYTTLAIKTTQPRPAVVAVYGGETRVLARRETYEDVMRADVWPLERAVRG